MYKYIHFKNIYRSRLGKNSFFSVLDQLLNLGFNFLLTILLARYLGVGPLGQYSLGLSVSGILMIFCDFGTGTIMGREIAKNPKKTSLYLGNSFGIKILISFPLLLIFITIFNFTIGFDYETQLIIFLVAIYSSFQSIMRMGSGALNSLHRNDLIVRVNVITKLVSLLGTFLLLSLNYQLKSLLVFYILNSIYFIHLVV